MPDLKIVPLGQADRRLLTSLMDVEVQAWVSELNWDFTPVRAILSSFIAQNLLPGYVALSGNQAVGYGYFLMYQSKGIIGTVFAPRSDLQQEIADGILAHAIGALKDRESIRRVEAQIMPFHNVNLTAGFTRHGFQCHMRYFMELDLGSRPPDAQKANGTAIMRWNPARLARAAVVTQQSYHGETDALICEDYQTLEGCENYLRSLMENPGCGLFLPDASFMAMDENGEPCGIIISSRISGSAGMIPQIAIHPAHQGRGLGSALMDGALEQFRALGLQTVGLTVTKKNRRAFEWYQRLGFRIKKEFGAYVWERP